MIEPSDMFLNAVTEKLRVLRVDGRPTRKQVHARWCSCEGHVFITCQLRVTLFSVHDAHIPSFCAFIVTNVLLQLTCWWLS